MHGDEAMSATKQRLTWSREPRQRGLAGVVQGERGYDLKYDGEIVGRARPLPVGHRRYNGYYWYAVSDRSGIPLRNTSDKRVPTIDEAKAHCVAYVRECLAATKDGGK